MLSELSRPVSGMPSLTIDVGSADRSHRPRIDVAGALVEPHACRLHKVVIDLLRHDLPHVIDVDLASVTAVDSAGIRVLEMCRDDAEQLGCRVSLHNLHPSPGFSSASVSLLSFSRRLSPAEPQVPRPRRQPSA
jgi:anti-anti-sigma regulatory factor